LATPGGTPVGGQVKELSLWQALYLNKHHNLLTKCLKLFLELPFATPALPMKLQEPLAEYLQSLSFEGADQIDFDSLDHCLSKILFGCSLVAKFLSNQKDAEKDRRTHMIKAEKVIEAVWDKALREMSQDTMAKDFLSIEVPSEQVEGCWFVL